jgi:predicted transcriptional regulator
MDSHLLRLAGGLGQHRWKQQDSGYERECVRHHSVILYNASAEGQSNRNSESLTGRRFTVIRNNTFMLTLSRKAPSQLEQVVLDYVWGHPDCTAEACREGVAGRKALKDSTIRTILRNLETKGHVTHTVSGRTFVYRAVHTKRNWAAMVAQQLIDRFCGGSVEELLIGLVDNQVLQPKQLQRLAEKIAARREKGK